METYKGPPEISEVSSLAELAEAMGLVETPRMQELRSRIILAIKDGGNCMADYLAYEDLFALEEIEGQDNVRYLTGLLHLMIMKASMYQDAQDINAFKEEFEHALQFATQSADQYPEPFTKIVDALKKSKAQSFHELAKRFKIG